MADIDANLSSTSLLSTANSEISARILPHLDRHLALPVVQFLEEQGVYPKQELLQAKYELLQPTNMVHYVESILEELEGEHGKTKSDEVEKRAQQIIRMRDELKDKADKVIEIISNPQVAAALGQDKERNLATLREKYSVRAILFATSLTRVSDIAFD